MKFMEIDEAGYVHHIRDDPQLSIIPLKNCFSHGDANQKPLTDALGNPISFLGHRVLPPMSISDADYAVLIRDGLCGVSDKGTKWHYQYNRQTKVFKKVDQL